MSRPPGELRVVIAGGGTGGHVIPGLAIAGALVDRGVPDGSVRFIGSARGIEARLVPEAGFAIELLPGRGIQRRLTLENLGAIWGLIRAAIMALTSLRRDRPHVVVSLGGYASVAAALSAIALRIPVVVTEQNARAGAANRLVGRFAAACAVPFDTTDLPRAVVTGNPVRPEILELAQDRDRITARAALDVPEANTLVVVFAGSLGATSINTAIVGLAEEWAHRGDLTIHHVLGARDWDRLDRPRLGGGSLDYRAVRYEERMDLALAAADLAVCRSGGTTVAELAVVGVPAVLVPFPRAPRDHQTANAMPLVEVGAAVLVPDAECTTPRLVDEVGRLLATGSLPEMAAAAKGLGRPDASDRVAELVMRSAG
ncbi:MAG TPA: undecaprenyldiphospho-muramoylpentapeptide beta-N-acetylglucosaminyltransferase [Microthrixaceae bacterium]|nr:undecaprenyldiphospho-muramoylpentapeptide beta-N-acetylglucosaminyltransferase [Microthrixaceae bacterium]